MKSICGKVVSSKPIHLSKASKILSNFVSVENGASKAVYTYLRRSSLSFAELIQLHKDLKPSHSDRKHKKHQQLENKHQNHEKPRQIEEFEDRKEKREKKEMKRKKKIEDLVDSSGSKKKKKKRKIEADA